MYDMVFVFRECGPARERSHDSVHFARQENDDIAASFPRRGTWNCNQDVVFCWPACAFASSDPCRTTVSSFVVMSTCILKG